ncbi:MAG: glycosyltransferase family 4 protein [Phycisphaeraceae bacterium]|nr:glycosyltransferase family 4 protein [Phycisphaeraceae bacterium]
MYTAAAMTTTTPTPAPAIGIVLMGGPLTGAMIRDLRLANELARRGYRVHLWWTIDCNRSLPLDPNITEHWLFHGMRYQGPGFHRLRDHMGMWISNRVTDARRAVSVQKRPQMVVRMMRRVVRQACDGVERDHALIQRFARQLDDAGVQVVSTSLAILGLWVKAARDIMRTPCRYVPTFQGHELYLDYARQIGREDDLCHRLRQVVDGADYPAIAVSREYRRSIIDELKVHPDRIVAIPPGVPRIEPMDRAEALAKLRALHPQLRADVPLILFLGRQDAEKGVDLLVYAAKMLRDRGRSFQLAFVGSTLFGKGFRYTCESIANLLQVPAVIAKQVTGELWSSWLAGSHVVVYPSVLRETFGMVPVEAMAHGTPAVAPNLGGVAGALEAEGVTAGLRFDPWDTTDLAAKLDLMLTDPDLWAKLAGNARTVAEYYSVARMGDRVLDHLGLPRRV